MKRKIKSGINVVLKPLKVNESAIHLQLEPTTACNLSCITCAHEDYIKSAKHLSLENFMHIVSEICPIKITLSGIGEPFANPKITDMIRHATGLGISVNTTSNMTLIYKELAENIVDSGLDLIKISVDAADAETYKKVRGDDCFDKLLEGLKLIAKAKANKKANKPSIRFNFVIQGANYTEMAAVVLLGAELAVEAIYFQPMDLVHLEYKKDELIGEMTKESLKKELARAEVEAKSKGLPTNLSVLIKELDVFWTKYEDVGGQQDEKKCLLPWFSTYVAVNGDVRPCCSFGVNPEANMGNIFEKSFDEIWNGDKYMKFRKLIKGGGRPFKICKNCVPRSLMDIFKYSNLLPGYAKSGDWRKIEG